MIAEKNGITVDTRTAAPARKMIKCPQKTGINLNLQEDRQRDRRTLLIGILAIAALVTVVVNFGVLQQYRRLDKAQAAYDRVHTQYVSAQEALADYDRVLLEYRTYSMDWMTAAGSEDIPAAVDRQAALDLLEQMQQAIAAIKASGQERALPQYDNDQALMTELDKLMAATLQYEVDCTEGTTQEGYLVLRPVTLTYQTASYAQSRQIIDALSASANVNFLSNVDVQYDADKAQYKTVLHLIFFELMP